MASNTQSWDDNSHAAISSDLPPQHNQQNEPNSSSAFNGSGQVFARRDENSTWYTPLQWEQFAELQDDYWYATQDNDNATAERVLKDFWNMLITESLENSNERMCCDNCWHHHECSELTKRAIKSWERDARDLDARYIEPRTMNDLVEWLKMIEESYLLDEDDTPCTMGCFHEQKAERKKVMSDGAFANGVVYDSEVEYGLFGNEDKLQEEDSMEKTGVVG